jgi:hypothetical protein
MHEVIKGNIYRATIYPRGELLYSLRTLGYYYIEP